MLSRRTFLGLASLTFLAACGGPRKPQLLRYDGPAVTQIQIYKAKRRMYLFSGQDIIKTYKISLGGNPVGPKRFEGDGRTPEGAYLIDRKNPNSGYHLSLGISYPDAHDVAYAESQGRKPGGDIFIHGRAGKHKGGGRDWTAGCIAVKDGQIEHIFAMVQIGTPVIIFP